MGCYIYKIALTHGLLKDVFETVIGPMLAEIKLFDENDHYVRENTSYSEQKAFRMMAEVKLKSYWGTLTLSK